MIVVDTNVWSELLRPEPHERVIAWERASGDHLWFSAIVLAEFRARAALLPPGRRRDEISGGIETIVAGYRDRVLPFDERCSRLFGGVLLSARRAGKPIQSPDAMIAATALAHGMCVATRDRNDFAGAGVEIIDPWEG
ncbi:type II toxin-antitoxin system VapC family toxin [Sphingomonas bacterium]|uniref:type II toxin-antitoxin system VapC family toxin n=1 Tax=Sphingomonas bacterium TaxID=1895847 RepID=UPI0015763930|nr:type II toxin-antitoxin system VapC family toxin [Sphingomonas bacterium]